jgi:hypothetical protein
MKAAAPARSTAVESAFATAAETEPNKNRYFSQNGRPYRVERLPLCGEANAVCRVIEGDFICDEVQLCHVVPGSRDDACEVIR